MTFKIRYKSDIDRLLDRHEALLRDAHLLQHLNPQACQSKLIKAKLIQMQVEELKKAYLN